MMAKKSEYNNQNDTDYEYIGRSYYIFCLEQALTNIEQARALVKGDMVDTDHELPKIEDLLKQAIEAS